MATQSQIEANRRNARRSTGPRSTEGKARSSQNALKHGIRSRAIISSQIELLGEDPEEFASLVQALVADLNPVGPFEETCVETIAISLWRLRRVVRAEMGYIAIGQGAILPRFDNPAGRACNALPDFATLDRLTDYEAYVERQLNRAFDLITRLQGYRHLKARREALDSSNEANPEVQRIKQVLMNALQPPAGTSTQSQPPPSQSEDAPLASQPGPDEPQASPEPANEPNSTDDPPAPPVSPRQPPPAADLPAAPAGGFPSNGSATRPASPPAMKSEAPHKQASHQACFTTSNEKRSSAQTNPNTS